MATVGRLANQLELLVKFHGVGLSTKVLHYTPHKLLTTVVAGDITSPNMFPAFQTHNHYYYNSPRTFRGSVVHRQE